MTPDPAISEWLLDPVTEFPDHWWLPGTGVSNQWSAAEEAIDRERILAAEQERRHPTYRRRRRGEETDG